MLCRERRQAGEWPHDQRREWRDWHQPNYVAFNRAMILLPLKPDPFVLARGIEALMCEARRHVVVREVCVQARPGTRHGVREEVGNEQEQRNALDPDNDAVVLACGHRLIMAARLQVVTLAA